MYGGERQEFTAERPFQAITHPVGTAEGCDLLTLPLWRGGLPPLGCKAAPKSPSHYKTLWRGSLLPLGCAAAPKSPNHYKTPWRGGLPPLGCAAAPKSPNHYKTLWRGGLPPLGCAAAPRHPRQPKPVARELAPAGLRSSPKTSIPDSSGKPQRLVSRLLRSRTGASSLATKALRCYSGDRARNRRPITSSTSHPSRNGMAQSKAKSLRMKDSQSIEPRMERFSST